ncbi:MAG: helix-turn-helix domain-containing protein [Clostridia bacterium]|nr:helix-turn-helix domain-containing protein [Clostridia bacterium]
MEILVKISERLKDLMDEAEMNISALAERTGLSASVISRILSCERMPSYKTLIAITDFFRCPADYIVGKTESWTETAFHAHPPFHERLGFLLNHFNVSKYKLEKDTGLKEETVNRWHKGKCEPTVEHVVTLANYFHCSVDFIIGRTDY